VAILGLGLELAARFVEAQAAPVERAIRLLQPVDRLRREAAALQALAVDSVGPRHVARGGDERRQILRQVRSHPGEGVRADVHELVHQRRGAEDRPVPDRDMARELAGIGEDGVAADLAVVREMHVRHDPVVLPTRVTPASSACRG